MQWKYGMIKVSEEIDLETQQTIDDICELVELYYNDKGEYCKFCKPTIMSVECLYRAFADVANDGVNTWFWENGTFSWSSKEKYWAWERYKT